MRSALMTVDRGAEPATDFGAAMDLYRSRASIFRSGTSPKSRRSYIARALLDVAGHAEARGLRDYQGEAVGEVAKRVGDTSRAPLALVVIPTGGGKTLAFQTVVSALSTEDANGARYMPNVVVLVPTKVLIRQTWLEFAKRFPELAVGYLSSDKLRDDDGRPLPFGVAPITVMTYSGFTEYARSGLIAPRDVDMLVMDEAHRGLSDLRQAVLAPFLKECVVSAWTATPAFDEEKNVQQMLGRGSEVYRISAEELRRKKVIAPVVNYVMAIRLEGREPGDRVAALSLRRSALVDALIDFVERHVEHDLGVSLMGKIAVFYGTTRRQARAFADAYNARFGASGERRMEVLTGEDSAERIRDVLVRVGRGEITALSNSMLLMEGFDMAKIGLVINSPASSLLKIIQQAGRVQRLDPGLPADSPDQTSFVIDTYYRVNGKVLGRPRFTFEALGDDTIATPVEMLYSLRSEAGAVRLERKSSRVAPRRDRPAPTVGFDVVPEVETVARLVAHRDEDAAVSLAAEAKTDDWMSFFELAEAVRPDRDGRNRLWDAFSAADAAFRSEGFAAVEGEVLDGGMRSQSGRTFFCLQEGSARRLAEICGLSFLPVRRATSEDVSFEALAAALGLPVGDAALRALWTDLDASVRARTRFDLHDRPLSWAFVDDGRSRYLAVHAEDVGRIRDAVVTVDEAEEESGHSGSVVWEKGYLSKREAEEASGITPAVFGRAWKAFSADVVSGVEHGLRGGYMVRPKHQAGSARAGTPRGGQRGLYLHRGDLKAFLARYKGRRSAEYRGGKRAELLSWPLPDHLTFPQACLALDSRPSGSTDLLEAWRLCSQAWARGTVAKLYGFEVFGRISPGSSGDRFEIAKASLVAFANVAGANARRFGVDEASLEVPEWTPDYVDPTGFPALFDAPAEAVRSGVAAATREGDLSDIRAGEMRKRGRIGFFLHVDDIGKFRQRFVRSAAPPKDSGQLTLQELVEATMPDPEVEAALAGAFGAVEAEWRVDGTITIGGASGEGGLRLVGKRAVFCLSVSSGRRLASLCGAPFAEARPAGRNDVPLDALPGEIGITAANPGMVAFRDLVETALRRRELLRLPGGAVRVALIDDGERRIPALARADLGRIKALLCLLQLTRDEDAADRFDRDSTRRMLDIDQNEAEAFDALWDRCEKDWKRGRSLKTDSGSLRGFREGGVVYIDRSSLTAFSKAMKVVPDWNEEEVQAYLPNRLRANMHDFRVAICHYEYDSKTQSGIDAAFKTLERTLRNGGVARFKGRSFPKCSLDAWLCFDPVDIPRLAGLMGCRLGGHRKALKGRVDLYAALRAVGRGGEVTIRRLWDEFYLSTGRARAIGRNLPGKVKIAGGPLRCLNHGPIGARNNVISIAAKDLPRLKRHVESLIGRNLPEWTCDYISFWELRSRISQIDQVSRNVFSEVWQDFQRACERGDLRDVRGGRMIRRGISGLYVHREDLGKMMALFDKASQVPMRAKEAETLPRLCEATPA